jgi:hypothetical protein
VAPSEKCNRLRADGGGELDQVDPTRSGGRG